MPTLDIIGKSGCEKTDRPQPDAASAGSAGSKKTGLEMTELEPTCLSWPEKIAQLKKSTEEARSHRQKLAKELKSAQRKNKRLKERARFLSEEDMVQILVLKRQKTAAAKEESASSSSSSSKGDKIPESPKTDEAEAVTRPEEEDETNVPDGGDF